MPGSAVATKLFAAAWLFLLLPCPSSSQVPAGQPTAVFISPNTESLDLAGASQRLRSPEETSLLAEGRREACELRLRPTEFTTLGLWQGGAEESAEFEMRATKPEAMYFAAQLGKEFRQREVLISRAGTGSDHLFQIVVRRKLGLRELAGTVLLSGIENATVTAAPPHRVIILGSGAEEARARKLAAELAGVLSIRIGETIVLGDARDLQKAMSAYDRLLADPSLGIHPVPCPGRWAAKPSARGSAKACPERSRRADVHATFAEPLRHGYRARLAFSAPSAPPR
jgi:hypothetical protein